MTYGIYDQDVLINTIEATEQWAAAYCAAHGYTYEPIAPEPVEPVEPEPTAREDTDAMLIDHEYRLTLLELGVTE